MTDLSAQNSAQGKEALSTDLLKRAVMPPIPVQVSAPLNSCTEFGKLRAVVVGSPVGANHPQVDTSFESFFTPPQDPVIRANAQGPIARQIVEEIEEDIAQFVHVLSQHGIEVLRPAPFDSTRVIKSPNWETDQLYSLMPRDCLFIHGHLYLEVPSPTRARYFETHAFRDIARAYAEHPQGQALTLSAPKPQLLDETFDLSQYAFLNNTEPLFDGANCVRVGKDIFMDINNGANMSGLRWLQNLFNGLSLGVTIHPMHIGEDHADVTIVPLRPGVILVDAKRVTESNLPEKFRSWTQIRVTDIPEQGYGLSYPMASNGIGRNVFMLDPHTAIVEKNQIGLIRELEKHDFQVIPLQYRHGRTLGGSWHCITLDTNRDDGIINYF